MESTLEKYVVRKTKEAGGMAIKLTPPPVGIPDRLILLPSGGAVFAEIKNGAKGRVSPAQENMHSRLRGLGCRVEVIRTRDDLWKILLLK